MNIGIDAKRIFFNHSGLGNYSRRFYNSLAKNLSGDSFFLYSPRPVEPGNPYIDNVFRQNSQIISPSSSIPKLFGGSLWRSGVFNGQFEKNGIKLYYGLSNEIPFGLKNSGIKSAVVIHDLIFLRYPELYPFTDRAVYRYKTVYACRNADYIIAASEQTRQDIINFYKIKADKISVIYPGTDPIFYGESVVDSGGFITVPRKYLLSIGAITPRKNLLKTVEAFALVKDRYDLDLVVIGTATGLGKKYLNTIRDFIDRKGIGERVHFLGNVPYHFLPDITRKASLMVYPSRFEGFGMPIVEALFSNIPVITTKGGCFPEAGGNGAIYIDPDNMDEFINAINSVMDSETLRKTLVEKGRMHAEKFRQDEITASILSFQKKATEQI